jgi:arylsulfatase A-like enzyme
MASYGYHRVTTPEIDRLAARGLHFRRSFSVAPWTLPAHASMFTGLHPLQHGATQEHLRLDPRFRTIAEILRDEGYRTFAVVNNPVLNSASELDRGFAEYLPMWRRLVQASFTAEGTHPTNRAVAEFLDDVSGGEPFFVFLNYIEAHGPYDPPPEFRRRFLSGAASEARALGLDQSWQRFYAGTNPLSAADFALLRDLYDGELAQLSQTISRLVDGLERRGLLADTLVILTSDHGENIGDHGHLDHVFNVYDSVLRTPLIVLDGERRRGEAVEAVATSVDLFETMLGAAASKYECEGCRGRDLLDAGGDGRAPEAWIAEYYYPRQVLSVIGQDWDAWTGGRLRPYLRRIRSLQTSEWKLIWGSDGRNELYDIARDPGERVDLADREPERVRAMVDALEAKLRDLSGGEFSFRKETIRGGADGFEGVDDETREQLRALGYVE